MKPLDTIIDTSDDTTDTEGIKKELKMLHKNKSRGMFGITRKHKIYAFSILVVFGLFMWFSRSGSSNGTQYIIVIDAGSSGSRIHVYPYSTGSGDLIELHRGKDFQKKLKPGLSSYTDPDDPDHPIQDAGKGIEGLLELARDQVPEHMRSSTPVYLYATAGMRKVQDEHPRETERCMEIVRDTIQASEFMFQRDWAQIITGIDEGLYGWVTSNYLNGWLQNHEVDVQSTGVFEMGGESVQLTFIPSESSMKFIPKDKLRSVQIGKSTYQVFTHSWMGVGLEAAQKRHDESNGGETSPCYIKGDTREGTDEHSGKKWQGSGDFDQCVKELKQFAAPGDMCGDMDDVMVCVVGGITIPKIAYEQLYYIENFLYTGSDLNPSHNGGDYFKDITSKGKEYCSLSVDEVKEKYPDMSDFDLQRTCFGTAWIHTMLDAGFGLKDFTRFSVVREVEGGDIDWAMGYGIQYASSSKSNRMTWTLYVVIGALLIGLGYVAFQHSAKQRYHLVNNSQFPL